jgi:multidrug efflux system outer membrane protein
LGIDEDAMDRHTDLRGHASLRRVSAAAAALLLLAVSGCIKLRKPPDAAALKTESMPTVALPPAWIAAKTTGGPVQDNWLASFSDPQLDAAVTEALAHNADLRVGAARVEQAQLYAKLAGAKLYPSVDLLARGGGKMSGDNSGLQGAALTLSWELDIWGRVRAGRAAASADARSAEADYVYARESLAALVAKSWFLATEAGLQAEVARGTIRDGEQLVSLAEQRQKVGVGNEEDVYVARAGLGTSRDALRGIELAREQAIRALELLLGRYPAGAAAVTAQLPGQPEAIPAGLPSELLERRPDVVAAERRVAAAFHRIQEAKAARLPAINLTTGISTVSSELFVLKDHENPTWNGGASLLAPIFRGGALKTQVEIRTAEQKQAVADYAAVGLRAFGEVESALSAEQAARDREQILAQTAQDYRRALEIVQTQFRVGSTDLRFVTQRQLALNAAQSALVRMQAEQRVQRINLHLALGGSFAPKPQEAGTPPPPPPPPDKVQPATPR